MNKHIEITVCSIIPRTDRAQWTITARKANLTLKQSAHGEKFKFLDLQNIQTKECLGYDGVHYRGPVANIVANAITDFTKHATSGNLFHCELPVIGKG